MTTCRRIFFLLFTALIAVTMLSAQSGGSRTSANEERTVEESYLQEAIELMIIREISQTSSLDQKLLALQYISDAIERGNKSEEICQTLEFLSMEGLMIQTRENGRLTNNFPLARREAAKHLGKMGTPEAQAALINICRYEAEPMVLQEAIKSLGDYPGSDNAKALEAIVWIVGRFDALNPDNMMALAAVDAIAKIAETNNGLKHPGAAQLLIRIIDGPYIRPVQNKARQVLSDLRKYAAQNSSR